MNWGSISDLDPNPTYAPLFLIYIWDTTVGMADLSNGEVDLQ